MGVTIWHNPQCTTSRRVLETLRSRGVEPTVVEYLKTPPDAATIKTVLKETGLSARELMRQKGTLYEEMGLGDEVSEEALIAAMVKHPILIERPVVRTAKGTRLCRPADRLEEVM